MNGIKEKPRTDVRGIVTRAVTEFFICAFTGWLYEVIVGYIAEGRYTDRGFLRLPICPIYGFAALPLSFLCKRGFVFITSTAVTTLIELAASYPIEKLIGYRLWDYSQWFMNYEGRISLISSLIFGVLGVYYIYLVKPFAAFLYRKAGIILTIVCTLMVICTAADLLGIVTGMY